MSFSSVDGDIAFRTCEAPHRVDNEGREVSIFVSQWSATHITQTGSKPRYRMRDTLEKMRANPAANWTIADVEKACQQFGMRCVPPSGAGSHYKLSHSSRSEILTVPSRRPIKPIYIRKLVQFIDAVRGADGKK